MRIGVILAARTGSRRLPGKALLPMLGVPMIALQIRRLKTSKRASEIILATTTLRQDDVLAATAAAEGIAVFRGSPEDLVSRYDAAAEAYEFDVVVRVTGDCPFTDGETLDLCLEACEGAVGYDLATTKPAWPRGIDYEIYPSEVMRKIAEAETLMEADREHLTKFIYDHEDRFRIVRLLPPVEIDRRDIVFLVDAAEDYNRMKAILERAGSTHARVADLISAS